jgi:hypothetical protein
MVNAVIKEIEKDFSKLKISNEFIKDFIECSNDLFVFEMSKKELKSKTEELINCIKKQIFFIDIEFKIGFNIGSFDLVNQKIKSNKYIISKKY